MHLPKKQDIHYESSNAKPFSRLDVLATPTPHGSKAIQNKQALDRGPGGPAPPFGGQLDQRERGRLGYELKLEQRCSRPHDAVTINLSSTETITHSSSDKRLRAQPDNKLVNNPEDREWVAHDRRR